MFIFNPSKRNGVIKYSELNWAGFKFTKRLSSKRISLRYFRHDYLRISNFLGLSVYKLEKIREPSIFTYVVFWILNRIIFTVFSELSIFAKCGTNWSHIFMLWRGMNWAVIMLHVGIIQNLQNCLHRLFKQPLYS